ncbi:rhodanese-like domain-containing protein [Hoylesella nanceiensis]
MKKILMMSILSTIFGLFSCNAQSKKFESVDVATFAKVIADSTVVLLDVRTPEEYEEAHIGNAINIDVLQDSFESKATSILPKNKKIALYCRSGKRSKKAANILAAKGYRIVELTTGYLGWIEAKK